METLFHSHRKKNYLFAGFLLKAMLVFLAANTPVASFGQKNIEDSLFRSYSMAQSDSDRIVSLGRLSDYYYANKNFSKGDSLIEKQIMLAEESMNRKLILFALFGNAGYRSTGKSTKDRSQNTVAYIKRALEYAKTNNLTDYAAMAYASLAALNCMDGQLEEAAANADMGRTTALNTENDSAKVVCTIQLGNVYLQKSDFLMAFKTYTNATDIAAQRKDGSLLPPVYHAIAGLYKKLEKDEIAKNYIFRSLAINKKNKNADGQIRDYIFLGQVSNYIAAKDYLQQAIHLADSLHHSSLKIDAQRKLFSNMMLHEKPSYMLAYLENQPELKNMFTNNGPDYITIVIADIYLYGGMPDSAMLYFKKGEISFNEGYDLASKRGFFGEFAQCLQELSRISEAIIYYKKSLELSKAASDLISLQAYSNELKKLYRQQGDYKQAFYYGDLYDQYKESVDIMKKGKDLALLEIDNETKRLQQAAELAQEQLRRKYNLQYMLITIVIATVFVLMIMIGMFKVSTFTIRLMGFLSLIFLFEFIILVLDKWIHGITHGEPWKNWLIKIAIISLLLPLHHFLEQKLIHYLLSRHLISVRSRISLKRFFGKKKKPLLQADPEGEAITSDKEKNSSD